MRDQAKKSVELLGEMEEVSSGNFYYTRVGCFCNNETIDWWAMAFVAMKIDALSSNYNEKPDKMRGNGSRRFVLFQPVAQRVVYPGLPARAGGPEGRDNIG